jgi:hypothetical protein
MADKELDSRDSYITKRVSQMDIRKQANKEKFKTSEVKASGILKNYLKIKSICEEESTE